MFAPTIGDGRQAPRSSSRRGFTLVELLVVIGIIALLISILLPSLNKAREAAKAVQCQSNMRQVYTSVLLYVHNFDQYLPTARPYWPTVILKDHAINFSGAEPFEFCPSRPMGEPFNAFYGMNVYSFTTPIKLVKLRKQAPKLVYLGDAMAGEEYGNINWLSFLLKPLNDPVTFASYPVFRHQSRAQIVFLDGHIEALSPGPWTTDLTQWAYWLQ